MLKNKYKLHVSFCPVNTDEWIETFTVSCFTVTTKCHSNSVAVFLCFSEQINTHFQLKVNIYPKRTHLIITITISSCFLRDILSNCDPVSQKCCMGLLRVYEDFNGSISHGTDTLIGSSLYTYQPRFVVQVSSSTMSHCFLNMVRLIRTVNMWISNEHIVATSLCNVCNSGDGGPWSSAFSGSRRAFFTAFCQRANNSRRSQILLLFSGAPDDLHGICSGNLLPQSCSPSFVFVWSNLIKVASVGV